MRKFLLLLFGTGLSVGLFAQGNIVWKDVDGNIVDTVNVYRHAQATSMELDAKVANITSNNYYVALKRTIVSYLTGGQDQLCYGLSCQLGNETNNEMVTAPSVQEGNSDISMETYIHYTPNEVAGTTILKYYIYADLQEANVFSNAPQDSLVVKYIVEPYARVSLFFNLDMANISGFDPEVAEHEPFVTIFQNEEAVGIQKLNRSNGSIYYASKAYDVDADLDYAYKYSYGTMHYVDGIAVYDTIGESITRSLVSIGVDDMTFDDKFDFLSSAKDSYRTQIQTYPNPFTQVLTLDNLNNVARIELSNILGQRVFSSNNIKTKMVLNTANLKNGVYFVKITDINNTVQVIRVIKQ